MKHLAAIALFAIAGFFYYLGWTVPTGILVVIGLVVEGAAWATLFAASSSDENKRGDT